jgi:GNAT superfamily N-acetyltransferase
MALAIRPAETTDADVIARLLGVLGYPQEGGEAFAQRLGEWIDDPASHVLVATDESGLLGVLAMHICPYFHRSGKWARIPTLAVAPRGRRHGVGRALITEAHEIAAKEGCIHSEVTSSRDRQAAHPFYRALGYGDTSERSARYWRAL